MIKINFQEPNTDEWREWCAKCVREQDRHNRAIETGKSSKIKGAIYRGERHNIKVNVYLNPDAFFYGKCAYCESPIAADQPGDIEHFRPKNEVRTSNGQVEMINTENGPKPHPGYYWLAYNWRNLLPSCRACNSVTKKKTGGQPYGKGNQFPVKGFRAIRPGEEQREEPLLINPVFQNPENYLEMDETGVLKAKDNSPEGQACINILGLNLRVKLVELRKDAYRAVEDKIDALILTLYHNSTEVDAQIDTLMDYRKGKKAYSFAGRAGIKKVLARKPYQKFAKFINSIQNSDV